MREKIRSHPFLCIYFLFSAGCILLLILFRASPSFAEWFSLHPAKWVRLALGGISSLLPFSLFEILILLFVLYLLFLLVLIPATFIRRKKGKKFLRLTSLLLIVPITLLTVLDLFSLSFASSYERVPVAEHMALPTEEMGEEEVFHALSKLVAIVNECAPALEKNDKGESFSPDLSAVKRMVQEACDAFGEKNAFYQDRGYKAKSFLSSPLMTYTHISGIFGFFTGEANVNTNYPHFIVTATLAHESCHARGIAPENECNFLASVILMESADPYLRYCGAAFVLDDFISTARKLDRERANEILSALDDVFWCDMSFYADFFDPYRDSSAAKVADSANSAYLKSMGQKEGTVSYSRIIRLVSAYLSKNTA